MFVAQAFRLDGCELRAIDLADGSELDLLFYAYSSCCNSCSTSVTCTATNSGVVLVQQGFDSLTSGQPIATADVDPVRPDAYAWDRQTYIVRHGVAFLRSSGKGIVDSLDDLPVDDSNDFSCRPLAERP